MSSECGFFLALKTYDASKFRKDLKDTVWGFVEGLVDCIDNFLCGNIFLKKARKTKQCTHSLPIVGCFSIFGFREVSFYLFVIS